MTGGKGWLLLVLVLLQCGYGAQLTEQERATAEPPLRVFLVRHAEKHTEGRDPALTEQGKQRAGALARLLSSTQLDAVYSTDYIRTRDTAQPTADGQGLPVILYDPSKLAKFAERLKQRGGQVLVVGHSNTTPQLVVLLGGEPGQPIGEKSEFDRLYLVASGSGNRVSTLVLRYGQHNQ